MHRSCESCGTRMSPFMPRKRIETGELVCRGCEDKHLTAKVSGLTLREQNIISVAQEILAQKREAISFYDGPHKDSAGVPIGVYDIVMTPEGRGEVGALYPDTPYYEGRTVQVEMEGSPGYRTYGDPGTDERDYRRFRPEHVTILERHPNNTHLATRKVAHDSGDGETIYHCPFCGAGQVVGRSDGTAECGFCSTAFTVQVQPVMNSVPQTINGVPHVHPDMPGTPGEAPVEEDPEVDATDVAAEAPGEAGERPALFARKASALPSALPGDWSENFDPDGLTEAEIEFLNQQASRADESHDIARYLEEFRSGTWGQTYSDTCAKCGQEVTSLHPDGIYESRQTGMACPGGGGHQTQAQVDRWKGASRYYVTAAGAALPEDAYLRHLALAYAEDRDLVLTAMRSKR